MLMSEPLNDAHDCSLFSSSGTVVHVASILVVTSELRVSRGGDPNIVPECGTKTREELVISAAVVTKLQLIQQFTSVNDIDTLKHEHWLCHIRIGDMYVAASDGDTVAPMDMRACQLKPNAISCLSASSTASHLGEQTQLLTI